MKSVTLLFLILFTTIGFTQENQDSFRYDQKILEGNWRYDGAVKSLDLESGQTVLSFYYQKGSWSQGTQSWLFVAVDPSACKKSDPTTCTSPFKVKAYLWGKSWYMAEWGVKEKYFDRESKTSALAEYFQSETGTLLTVRWLDSGTRLVINLDSGELDREKSFWYGSDLPESLLYQTYTHE